MTTSPERFTAAERALLAPYVTTTEGSVFALTNLPEVIKGALFSRYSRSTLGLRRLLLKEFISADEAAFADIAGGGPGGDDPLAAAQAAHLAVQRAQDFYDRILDGYGDDSIGELGGAHVALEDVSMIATKVLEDARIGGSPLEKSTRYVSFAEQVDGDFRFYKEPALMASPHRETYLGACRALFETYRDLIEPLTAHVERLAPRAPGVSAAAWRRSVRARVYDGLRGLLPASTLTNMGVFGNGRFWEALTVRLRTAPLAELRDLGAALHGELNKVIPSFVRRGDPAHPHFAAQRDAEAAMADLLAGRLPPDPPGAPPAPAEEEVRLVAHDPQAESRLLAALAFPHSHLPLPELERWAAGLGPAAQARAFAELADCRGNRRHKPPRALERVYYTFDLLGDFGMYRDLHRHRMLTQMRQPLTTRHGYALPEEVAEAGLAPRYEAVLARAAEAFEAIHADFPLQAQYVVPMACRIRWFLHVNLRALIWLVELRSSPQGHPAYRRTAQALYRRVAAAHPAFAPLFRFVDLEAHALGRLGAEQRRA